ncbi:MAG: ATP synthase subunit I [Myxococcales bacterium]|nr:ATP synthase subunit I [Myxococcales bacterium]
MPRIERLNYLFGGVLVIVCAVATRRDQALGAAVGVALTCLNFWFMNRLIGRWIDDAKRGDGVGANRIALIMPKMVALMGAVVLSLAFLPIDAIFFVIGYSVFIVSIVVEGVLSVLRPAPSTPDSPDESSTPTSSS